MMKYKGYLGEVTYDDEAKVFHGEIVNVKAVLTFQGRTVEEIETAFRDTVDDYLDWCQDRGKEPEKPFSGHMLLRINPKLHEKIFLASRKAGKSLNAWISETLSEATSESRTVHFFTPEHGDRLRVAATADSHYREPVIPNLSNSMYWSVPQKSTEVH